MVGRRGWLRYVLHTGSLLVIVEIKGDGQGVIIP